MSNSKIKIADLLEKIDIQDNNLIIVEDDEDTKKSTVKEFKKGFSGDYVEPSENKFYSSRKVTEMVNKLNIAISTKTNKKELDELYARVDQIITSNPDGTKDQELIDARGSQTTLSNRFDYEREVSNNQYVEKIKSSITGDIVDLNGHIGFIDIDINRNNNTNEGSIILSSKNIFNLEGMTFDSDIIKQPLSNGFQYKQSTTTNKVTISIPIKEQKAGTFYFLSNISMSESFNDRNAKLVLAYKDGTTEELVYNHSENFKFVSKKILTGLSLKYNIDNIVNNATVTFSDMMITQNQNVPEFIPYYYNSIDVDSDTSKLSDVTNNDYIITSNIPNSNITVHYYNHKYTMSSIVSDIDIINKSINNKLDTCNLIEDYGTYQFLDNAEIISYPESMIMEDSEKQYYRNGVPSKKITIATNATTNPSIKLKMDSIIPVINHVSLSFYIDRTVFYNFTDTDGIRLILSSDPPSITSVNYYTYTIKKSEMVQGWNTIKKPISEFTSVKNPDYHNIKSVTIEIGRNDNLNGSVLYINSLVFNQKMKPTILLSFDGTYDTSIPYLYPYLKSRKIPASLFLNNSRTLNAQAFDYLIGLRIKDGWDIGAYGCNPNKEQLTEDNNYRNQYIALRSSRQWLQDNILDKPVSYSAPYGNLRPITVPILKDLGYKIARNISDGYVSIFTEKDFAIPMHLISNLTTFDKIKQKIDYAIDNGLTLSLYTRDVTEYGSEADSTQVMFESIVDYILGKRNEGKLQCLTMKDFYERCVE